MDQEQIEKGNGTEGTENGRAYEDRRPIQFVQVSMSKNGKWLFIDTVSRACIHINYVRAIDRNKLASLAQEGGDSAHEDVATTEASAPIRKGKRARKENDRTA